MSARLENALKSVPHPIFDRFLQFSSGKIKKKRPLRLTFFLISLVTFFIVFSPSLVANTRILVLGDSLTAGFGLEKDEAFPYLLNQQLIKLGYKETEVINGGFSGSTSASAIKRMRWYLKIKPDILILELGANDGLRGHKIESIRKNLEDAIRLALDNGIKVILAGMKMPRNYGEDYTNQFEAIYWSLAEEYSITLIPFLLEGVAGKPELNLADGIHPNPEGQEIVSKTVLKYVLPLLKK
ncbi:arylesterase [bacterium]|nr:arylesterase [bacterium]